MKLRDVHIEDKYTADTGHVYISGTQALVRLLMMQQWRDTQAGIRSAGFVSGYRGSPLGTLDMALWKAKTHLAKHHVQFQSGINEDLAATAVWGSQQTNMFPGAKYDGVFGLWYGKGPGLDRSLDVVKHANAAGTSKFGGVLAVVGDDHASKSSTLPHQSEHVLKAACVPVFYPASVQEYLDLGLHAYAMSRYTGLWAGFKCVTDLVESTSAVIIDPHRVKILLPEDFILPDDGLNIRWPDTPLAQEARLLDYKLYAALAYVRKNKLNYTVIDAPNARLGLMCAGKAYLDTRQALTDLGLDDSACAELGIRLYKVGVVWPLDAVGVRDFAQGLEEILVIEEKRQLLEYQLKEELYNWREDVRPRVFGKFDDEAGQEKYGGGGEWAIPQGKWLLPAHYELSPALIAKAIAQRLEKFTMREELRSRIANRIAVIEGRERALTLPHPTAERKPFYCSGCPHNTSTKVPDGSRAIAGIGCHYMVLWMDRETSTFTQMGGEGITWLGQANFTHTQHVFANLGDGTYFHSGSLAIRAAVAAGVSITYKILFNDAVAMTGGQAVDGVITVPQITRQMAAEGVKKIVIATDEPEKYTMVADLASGVTIHHRDELDHLQRELREYRGVSILIYDQTCASEKRRRRKKNTPETIVFPDPDRRLFINDRVCEGCGDCSTQSSCLSVEPLETAYGRKRKINQSSCNKDFSCVKGFCPSFVSVSGGKVRKGLTQNKLNTLSNSQEMTLPTIPLPTIPKLDFHSFSSFGVLITGVGGTGVVTIGQWIGMAAHLEGKGCTVLDMAGLAQKGGAVYSHVQLAPTPETLFATKITTGDADLVLGCDLIVTGGNEALVKMHPERTRAVLNNGQTPTADFLKNRDWVFPQEEMLTNIREACGGQVSMVDATMLATAIMGDAIYANPFMLGFAWQKGWLPLSHEALLKAIELNGVAIKANQRAFEWGRASAHDLNYVRNLVLPAQVIQFKRPQSSAQNVDEMIKQFSEELVLYQNQAYAERFQRLVEAVRGKELSLNSDLSLTKHVARYFYKLMAYKDEYEVARLFTDSAFTAKLHEQFEGDFKLKFHLAPPLFAERDPHTGVPKKIQFGGWLKYGFKILAKLKGLRGSAFDVFGYTHERKLERQLIDDYEAMIQQMLPDLTIQHLEIAIELAKLPELVRGFGHIKAKNIEVMQAKKRELLELWEKPNASGLSNTIKRA